MIKLTPEPVDFNKGIESIIKTIEIGKDKPTIVTINGLPDSGKTKLMIDTQKILFSNNIQGWSGMSNQEFDLYFRDDVPIPVYVLLEDVGPFFASDNFVLSYFGKNPDLRVYIYRQMLLSEHIDLIKDQRNYDAYGLIIENPDAMIKMPKEKN